MAYFIEFWSPDRVGAIFSRGPVRFVVGGASRYSKLNVGDNLWLLSLSKQHAPVIAASLIVTDRPSPEPDPPLYTPANRALFRYCRVPVRLDGRLHQRPIGDKALPLLRFEPSKRKLAGSTTSERLKGLASLRQVTAASATRFVEMLASTASRSERHQSSTAAGVAPKAGALYPDEVPADVQYVEGATKQVTVNAYERDTKARTACIAHHGHSCSVCAMSFETVYGDVGKYFIHVHHLRPLAAAKRSRVVDPVRDLAPVCPNCHAMLHRRSPPLSPKELKRLLARAAG